MLKLPIVGVNTNNGLERQNQVFKYTYLQRHKNNSLSGMLSVLIEEFLPDNYNRYCKNVTDETVIYTYRKRELIGGSSVLFFMQPLTGMH
jgi:hypothetical protein